MTICIAIKTPCKELEHRKLPVKYDPGIVISADTRYVADKTQVIDDGIKIWTLSKFAVAGFAGNVQLAEISLIAAKFAIEDLSLIRHEDISKVVQKWFLYYYYKFELKNRPDISHTELILSIYDSTRNRFYLYLLSSKEGFNPNRRDGILAIGSGSKEIESYLAKQIENRNTYLSETDTGFKTVQINNSLSHLPRTESDFIELNLMKVSFIAMLSIDELIKTSGLSSIGGLTQNYMLTETGVSPIKAKISSKGKPNWKSVTASEMRSYADMINGEFSIPSMKKDFSIVD